MIETRLYAFLAAAGVLPFVACALMPYLDIATIGPLGSFDRIAAAYGLAIVSFLAGVHWGTHLYRPTPFNLLAISNVVTVGVWIAFLIAGPALRLAALSLAFLVLLVIDRGLFKAGVISGDYFKVRVIATAVALVSLGAMIAALRKPPLAG